MIRETLSLLLSAVLPLLSAPAAPPSSVTQAAAPAALSAPAFDDFYAQRAIWDQNPVDETFLASIRGFSAQTTAGLLTGQENACYSPASLYFALSLSAAGAAGNTETQLLDLLSASDVDTLTQNCGNLYRVLYTDNEVGKMQIANALWMESGAEFTPAFLQTASEDFYASLYTADLDAPATVTAMEQWVADHTGGKIQPTIQPTPDTILYLMNTIYLTDQWTALFDADENTVEPFHCADGTTPDATYMHRKTLSSFVRGDGYLAAGLSLKSQGSVTFVLPDEGVAPADLLTPERLSAILAGGTEEQQKYGHVTWTVPKFSYDSKLDLKPMLQACGVTDLFDAERADLSDMTSLKPAFLSGASQQTYIGVNEQGVEAAAYTELSYAGSAAPEDQADMRLDRPFLYIIKATNDTPLFIGVCANPT